MPDPLKKTPSADEASSEAVPALQPGGIALPFDPRAKRSLPFDLPEDGSDPFASSSRASSGFDLPEAAPLQFELPKPAPLPFEMPGGEPSLPAARVPPIPPRGDRPGGELLEAEAAPLDVAEVQAEVPLHIPCPSGHVLEVTRDILDQEVMCPYCRKRFLPQWEKSLEYRREQRGA